MPRNGQSRFYERIALGVAIAAVLIVALSAAADGAEAQTAIPVPPGETTTPESSTSPDPTNSPEGTASDPAPQAAGPTSKAAAEEKSSQRAVRLTQSKSAPGRLILDTGKKARFVFTLSGSGRHDVTVRAINVRRDKVMSHWKLAGARGGERQVVKWNGKRNRRAYAPEGKYTFKVFPTGKRGADPIQETTRSRKKGKTRITFKRHIFPLPAKHSYGDGFGAGRNHKGQDVFAKCGKKIRAARGGKVQFSGYHSSAGYYVVVDGRGTGWDYVYMHLKKKGKVREGKRIRTGARIGYNSDSGNASGCHLHFEMWSPTGWYEGGDPKPVTKRLRKWDRYS